MTLVRGAYSPELQLILVSKALSTRARTAIRRLLDWDIIEGPRRELEQQKKDADDAAVASEKARTANKAAFRP